MRIFACKCVSFVTKRFSEGSTEKHCYIIQLCCIIVLHKANRNRLPILCFAFESGRSIVMFTLVNSLKETDEKRGNES